MATSIEQLVTQAMELPGESRARLAELLVESLEADDIGPVEKAWLAEAKRRRDDVRTGRVEPIDGEDALLSVRNSIT
ncbi:MAG TPA: addiction module protein [Pyrinomonadaceae bacterium]